MARVLLVDDAAFMRMSMKNMLEKHGFTVIGEAVNGTESIEKYVELRPDVVTMDVTMPEMDGIQALKRIMSIDPAAKVLMVTAMGKESMVKEAILSGARGFVVKPFKEEMLVNALKKAVQ